MNHLTLISTVDIAHIRIAIAAFWTAGAAFAAFFHFHNMREAQKNQHAVRNSGPLGTEVAKMLVRMEQDRFAAMLTLTVVGVCALIGPPVQQYAGWGLLLLPLIGIWGSIADRHSRIRQAEIVKVQLARTLVAKKVTVTSSEGSDEVVVEPDDTPDD
jgi:hypothetical protein